MRLSQSGIAQLYLYALALGATLGLFFDCLRFPRILFTRNAEIKKGSARSNLRKRRALGVFVFLEDFLFCIIASVCVILLFYEHNHGKIRPLVFFLLFGGFAFYRATVGRWVRAFLRFLANGIRRVTRKICATVWRPIRKLILIVWNAVRVQWQKRERKAETKRLFRLVERDAAGLLPGGEKLKKRKKSKERRSHVGRKNKEDHRAKQKSVA